jgi:tetratricopeptide (TPR) repeat protein
MELSSVLSQQGIPEMEQIVFNDLNPNLSYALETVLRRPVVIIIDEAQRFFHADSGKPLPETDGILKFLGNRRNLPGRLLLLSDRNVDWSHGSEWIPKRTLYKLEPDEAIEALDARMKESGVSDEIPLDRKKDVVRALDFNARAIEALVGALHRDSLNDIIESDPGLWAVQDREVSRDFIRELEHRLLERTMRHLEDVHKRRLWRLAVHRRSFKREALDRVCGTKEEVSSLRSNLESRFLLNFYKGALALNPIVREISLSHLRDEPAEYRQAHSGAADYHMRHFTAKQIVASQSKLGESFAELRYHLVQAAREAELGVIGQRFTDHLKQEIRSVSRVPTDREELDERIGVLTVLLGNAGAKGLEYHLARCLQSRSKPGDIEQAIAHVRRAIDRGIADPWLLLADLLAKAGKTDEAVALLKEGIKVIPPDKSLCSLYQSCADLLAKAGKTDEAVALLKEGIKVIPPDKNLFSLYQLCADLLAKAGKTDGAVVLLKEGIKVIPPDKSLFSLYQICADLLAKAGKTDEAVALLKEGIKVIPPDKGLVMLYQGLAQLFCRKRMLGDAITTLREGTRAIPVAFARASLEEAMVNLCRASENKAALDSLIETVGTDALGRPQKLLAEALRFQDSQQWSAALSSLAAARTEFPTHLALASAEAFCRLASSDAESALKSLLSIPNKGFRKITPILWLETFIHIRGKDLAAATESMSLLLERAVDTNNELTETFLLELWDQRHTSISAAIHVCAYYPVLPPALTAIGTVVRRLPYGKAVLPPPRAMPVAGTSVTSPPTYTTEVYVSYSWGEDATETGRQREEIVDRLCAAVTASGRAIGRDKDRMRGGDSIERFAHEISKAKRIIAVISEKSLQSEFCMAHELFRAFRRCDYQRAEFQEKVIALVMDDAKPYLNDHLAIVALAKNWQQRLDKLRTELHSLDPTRKSPNLWIFVDMMEDMCPRLPDMLGALKDIVMKRGFEEITKDGFNEVIRLLPAPSGK